MVRSGKAVRRRGFLEASGLPALLVVLFAGAAAWFWLSYIPRERAAAVDGWSRDLDQRANIRKEALQRYFTDSFADAATLASYPTVSSMLTPGLASVSSEPAGGETGRGHLEKLFNDFARVHGVLGVVLWDAAEKPVAKSGDFVLDNMCAGPAREVLSSGRPEAGFHLHADVGPVLTFAAPVLSPDGATRGAVVIAVDPREWVYPLLSRRLAGTSTGEAVLVGRDGADALFLSPLRGVPDAPLKFRHPLGEAGFAARVALEGAETVGPYVDYRGVRVLAGGRRLPPSPWALVVKIDEQEALADFRGRMRRTAVGGAAVLVAIFGVAWGVWQRRERLQQAALSESQARFGVLLDHTNDAIWFISKDGRILEANRAAEEMYGRPRQSFVGLDVLSLRPESARAAAPAELGEAMSRGRLLFETEHLRSDGTVFPVEVSTRRLDLGGQPVLLSIVRDITERKRAEEALRESERRYQSLFEDSPVVLWLEDFSEVKASLEALKASGVRDVKAHFLANPDLLDGLVAKIRVLDVNRAGVRIHGARTKEELLSNLGKLFVEESREALALEMAMIAEGRTVLELENPMRSLDGRLQWVGVKWEAAAGCEKTLERVIVSAVDITERKRAEARIRQLNRLLRTISEINQAIVRTDDRDALLREACRVLVEHGGFRMAWIGLVDPRTSRVVPAARAGEGAEYLDGIEVRCDDSPKGRGPVGTAIRTGQHVVIGDIAADPNSSPWLERQLAFGFRSAGAFPVPVRGEVVGALKIYSAEFLAIGEEETRLLDELAADFGYALEALDDRAERQRAEEALRESEERFRSLFENALLGLYRTTPDGAVLMANPCLCRMLGYDSFEELNARNLEEEGFEPSYPRSVFRTRLEEEGGVIGLESRWKRRDGSVLIVRESATAIRDGSGKVLYYEGTVENITERRRAEEALEKSELYYRSLIENSLDITAVLSPEGKMRYVSSSVERILGYRPEQLGGTIALELVHPEDLALARSKLQRVFETGTRFETVEARFRHRDGSWRVLSVIGKLLPPEIEERGLIVSARDVTERHQLEAQLLQAQKMESVGQLAGGVAHDFNNLLTVIQGYGEMLSTSLAADEVRREEVGEILKAAERAATLTRQLLAFSRRQVLELRVLDLREVVGESEKMLRRLIGEDIELVVVKPRGPSFVKVDPGQIEQILLNLAVNSRDAMPAGGRLTIELAEEHLSAPLQMDTYAIPAGSYAVLAVSDTGSGMDAQTLSHLFEPFFTTKEKGKGTGLGLATVYGIVKQSDGFVAVESEPGCGTTFRIYLPRAEGEPAPKPEALTARTGGAETILLVEDEPGVRDLARRLLEARGYLVLAAATGADALALADRHGGPIHLLVTDLVMPGMGGREVAGKVMSRRPETRVLLMSGYSSGVFSREDLSESGAHLLQKPFTEAALARAVREVLDAPAAASGGFGESGPRGPTG